VGAVWQGYHADSAVSIFVDGAPSELAERLVKATELSLEAGIAQIQAGARLYDIGHAVQEVAEEAGFSLVREYAGHGIGRALHEDPHIPNYGEAGRGPVMREGLVVAVEPMVNVGDWRTRVLADKWTVVTADGSLSAHFEHTIAITADGPEVLTARNRG
jgi:methionyl aminopeptidase